MAVVILWIHYINQTIEKKKSNVGFRHIAKCMWSIKGIFYAIKKPVDK